MNKLVLLAAALAASLAEGAASVTGREARAIAEEVVRAHVANASTRIPDARTNLVSYVVGKADPETGEVRAEDEDGSVVIGKGAGGTISAGTVEGLEVETHLRSEAVAIGHNATVTNSKPTTVQGIAIGWNAKAVGNNAVALGSGARHWYEGDLDGGSAYAGGSEAVAVGYGAKSLAKQAVQIGSGVNASAGSLKFRDVWVVKDGRLAVEVGTNDVTALVEEYFRPKTATRPDEITVRSHALTVFSPSEPPEETALTPTGSRNYEIYIPDTEQVRSRLPLCVDTDFAGAVKVGPWWTNRIDRLPALVRVREPVRGTCVLEVEIYGE